MVLQGGKKFDALIFTGAYGQCTSLHKGFAELVLFVPIVEYPTSAFANWTEKFRFVHNLTQTQNASVDDV